MLKNLIFGLCLFTNALFGIEQLPEKYLVSYGNSSNEDRVIFYFSFMCPCCLKLFRNEFHHIKENFLDNNAITFVFHPVPLDLLTVQAMVCLEKLSDTKKKIFLEAIFEEIDPEDAEFSSILMGKAMEALKDPIPELRDKAFLSKTNAFLDAYKFLKQEEKIYAVPSVEVNGEFYGEEVPDSEFIHRFVQQKLAEVRK